MSAFSDALGEVLAAKVRASSDEDREAKKAVVVNVIEEMHETVNNRRMDTMDRAAARLELETSKGRKANAEVIAACQAVLAGYAKKIAL